MLKKDHINFDILDIQVDNLKTDIIGDVRTATAIFQPGTFASIFCAHVIEHFYRHDAIQLLKDCFTVLRPGGVLIVEAPDFAKMIRQGIPLNQLIAEVYGDAERIESVGPNWSHKWGWTGEQAGKAMEQAGFHVRFTGDGWMHNKTFRDFRVEAVKPNDNWLGSYAMSVTSQHGEDGIIAKIFGITGTTNRFCVEFGAWDGKYNSNTWSLIHKEGWQSLQIEHEPARVKAMLSVHAGKPVQCIQRHVGLTSPDTLTEILDGAGVPKDLDFLSIDVDGPDYQIWQSLETYRPRVVCIECCADFPSTESYVHGQDDRHAGSSLLAIATLAARKGYTLVTTIGVNAFFVVEPLFDKFGITDQRLEHYPLRKKT